MICWRWCTIKLGKLLMLWLFIEVIRGCQMSQYFNKSRKETQMFCSTKSWGVLGRQSYLSFRVFPLFQKYKECIFVAESSLWITLDVVVVVDSLNDWHLISPVAAPGTAVHISDWRKWNKMFSLFERCHDQTHIEQWALIQCSNKSSITLSWPQGMGINTSMVHSQKCVCGTMY